MLRVLVHDGELDDAEQHHLRVRRVTAGDVVEVRDGRGLVGRARLVSAGKQWSLDIVEVETVASPPSLALAVGAGDRDRFGWLVEKAAELGVTEIVPLETERTAGVASKLRGAHIERLQRRALEAIKQSGAAWAPVVRQPVTLEAFLAMPHEGSRWLADMAGEPMPAELGQNPVTVAVGPEGGFSDEERARLCVAGFTPVAVAAHTLRFETAALAAAVVVGAARGRIQAASGTISHLDR